MSPVFIALLALHGVSGSTMMSKFTLLSDAESIGARKVRRSAPLLCNSFASSENSPLRVRFHW
jgi:hypothetical protein